MRFFLDSANIEHIRIANDWGVISGVTTNPSLVAKEGGVDFHSHIEEIAGIVDGPVSAEVISLDTAGMISEARELAAIGGNVVVKIPMCREGMAAVRVLSSENINTNVTLVFSVQQALLAASAGASYVSPFVGRLDDIGEDGIKLVCDIADIFRIHSIDSQIIAASLRNPLHILASAKGGAHFGTVPFSVLGNLFEHPLTDKGIKQFIADWEASQKK